MRAWIRLGAFLIAVAAPAAGGAQTISAEVMKVLTRGMMTMAGDNYDLTVGALPKTFPSDLVPAGGEAVASTTSASMQVAVIALPGSEDTVRSAHARALHDAGWVPAGPSPRGFSMTGSDGAQVCKEFSHVNVLYSPKSDGGTYVRIGVQTDTRRRCAPRTDPFFSDVPIPSLRHPDGVRGTGGGSGGNADGYYSATRVASTLSSARLAAHYGHQMVSAGWTEVARLGDDQVVMVRYRVTTKAGESVVAVLLITAVEGYADLFLRITRGR